MVQAAQATRNLLYTVVFILSVANAAHIGAAGTAFSLNFFQHRGDEGWVCKMDPTTGTCGEVDMRENPDSLRVFAIRFFGCKSGRCRSHGFTKFIRREEADCGVLGFRESNICVRPTSSSRPIAGPHTPFRTLVNRSLQRVILGSDAHPGRTLVM